MWTIVAVWLAIDVVGIPLVWWAARRAPLREDFDNPPGSN